MERASFPQTSTMSTIGHALQLPRKRPRSREPTRRGKRQRPPSGIKRGQQPDAGGVAVVREDVAQQDSLRRQRALPVRVRGRQQEQAGRVCRRRPLLVLRRRCAKQQPAAQVLVLIIQIARGLKSLPMRKWRRETLPPPSF